MSSPEVPGALSALVGSLLDEDSCAENTQGTAQRDVKTLVGGQ